MFGLSFTYSGHPVSAAVAREALRIYEDTSEVQKLILAKELLDRSREDS